MEFLYDRVHSLFILCSSSSSVLSSSLCSFLFVHTLQRQQHVFSLYPGWQVPKNTLFLQDIPRTCLSLRFPLTLLCLCIIPFSFRLHLVQKVTLYSWHHIRFVYLQTHFLIFFNCSISRVPDTGVLRRIFIGWMCCQRSCMPVVSLYVSVSK